MIWKVQYTIDTGYDWIHRVCIIKAKSKEAALDILHTEIESKLKGDKCILHEYTEITECEGIILYDGRRKF